MEKALYLPLCIQITQREEVNGIDHGCITMSQWETLGLGIHLGVLQCMHDNNTPGIVSHKVNSHIPKSPLNF